MIPSSRTLRSQWIPFIRRFFPIHPRPYTTMPATSNPVDDPQEPLQLRFMEEPLGLPASEGFGYYQARLGGILGPGDRYKLEAKLGYGMASSVWLAKDLSLNKYVALKILTGRYTRFNQEDKLQELTVLQRLSSPQEGRSLHSICLLDHFYQPGVDVEDGQHLCLAMELMASPLSSIRKNNSAQFIPIPIVKRILCHMLRGIAYTHSHGIAHTDIKPDNIMINLGTFWTTASIDAWLKDSPPKAYPPEKSLNKMVTSYVSQSLPQPSLDTLMSHTFKLADFGSAQIVAEQTTDDITPLGLRPPEIILGGQWNESVDIWTFGCLVFNVLTGNALFKPLSIPGQSEEDTVLYQMICFCGEFFHENLLQRCSKSLQYFDLDCRPKPAENKSFFRKTFQQCILDSGFPIAEEDVEGATAFMTRCLRLDPKNRATAVELLEDPWLTR